MTNLPLFAIIVIQIILFIRKDEKMNRPKGKYAWSATVGEKGQIVIPRQARELFNIKPGDTLIILGDEKRGLAIPPRSALAGLAAAVFDAEKEENEE